MATHSSILVWEGCKESDTTEQLSSMQDKKKICEGLGLLLLHPRSLRGKPWRGVTHWPKLCGSDAGWAGPLAWALQTPASSPDLHSDSARSLVTTANLN